MKDIKTQLTELSVQIKPLDEHIKRIDQDVEDMIDTEKNKKINAADEQLNELNKAVADVDFKTANAEKLLEQYRTLIAGAKSKEAVHDAQLDDWLNGLDDEAQNMDGRINDQQTQVEAIKEDREKLQAIVDEAFEELAKFTPYAID